MSKVFFFFTPHLAILSKNSVFPSHPLSFSMASKKKVLEKRKRTGSSSWVTPPLPDNLNKFITRDAETLYHESLYNRTFVPDHGIQNYNVYFPFMIQVKGYTNFVSIPTRDCSNHQRIPLQFVVLGSFLISAQKVLF